MSYQREFEKKLSVAIVGVGSHAYRNILPIMTYLPVSLRAVCDINLERAQITAAQYGAKAVYENTGEMYQKEELDAVFLCVSAQLHPQLACEAFDAGLHVCLPRNLLKCLLCPFLRFLDNPAGKPGHNKGRNILNHGN